MRRFFFILAFLAVPAMAQFVPVDTAIVVQVGPLIDSTDFTTPENAIAYNATGMGVDLIKGAITGAGSKTDLTLTTGSTQDWTFLGNGMYEIEITSAQNDTEGTLQVIGVCDGVIPFFSPVYTVVPVVVYNSIVAGSDYLQTDAIQIEGVDATNQINAEADTALADYDAPTNAEMVARTLVAASYFDPAADTVVNVGTVATLSGHTPQTADHTASIAAILADTAAADTASELQTLIFGSATAGATATALATAQADLDILTGSDGVTLATAQANYAPATAAALATHDGKLDTVDNFLDTEIAAILEDTGTTLPGTLATLATASALDTVDNFLDTEIAAILADTDELQTRLANMIEADGGDWRYTTNALEQAPGGGGGGDATAANQTTIITHLTDIKGATFNGATDSLEAIRNQGDAAWGGGGSGDTPVNEDTGGTDALAYKTSGGAGIQGATIRAYLTSEYNAGVYTVRGQTTTTADGGWSAPMMLEADTSYTLVFYKAGAYGPDIETVTP